MSPDNPRIARYSLFTLLIAAAAVGGTTFKLWWPSVQRMVHEVIANGSSPGEEDHPHDDGHDHSHGSENSIEISPQAMKSLGLDDSTLKPAVLSTYRQSITVPAIIVGRPGRTRLEASTPIAGVITHVHAVQGEAVQPGAVLFQLRITAEAMVNSQMNLLRLLGELDVETREIARLSKAVDTGAVASRNLLERQYAQEKLQSQVDALREGLRLVGLSDRQIEEIVANRKLLKELLIVAPSHDDHSDEELKLADSSVDPAAFHTASGKEDSAEGDEESRPLILQEVLIHKGETVAAGQTLAVLTDNSELFIEGQAFEQDAAWMTEAVRKGWKASAAITAPGGRTVVIEDLAFAYTGSVVDADARTLPIYVRLPNVVERSEKSPDGQSFIDWRYRPGQRLQLRIPVVEWKDRFVLPADAIARDGLDSFVFRQNGRKFDRVRVTVEYRDRDTVVVADDNQLYPGNVIALRGAHQLQMALKNRSGGAVDPHAGHNH
ncbi:efflux RND transporter periplasmic adaptor subunit [Caulifigura coniformis]|nr:HlyD family efflux transporter periplasmic adaptor subunit [Caulifigura coniformis]